MALHSIKKNAGVQRMVALIAQRGSAQGFVFLSTLFTAKYATPEVFGQVGLFTSLCSFFSMGAGLRLEIRGLVCKRQQTRERFLAMAYAANLFFFAAGMAVVAACFAVANPPTWLWLVPTGILLWSLIQYVLPAQNSSAGELRKLGWMNQVIAAVTSGGQILAAIFLPSTGALIGSRLSGWGAGAMFMVGHVRRGLRQMAKLRLVDAKRILRSSRREILFGVPASIVSVAALQVPVYVLTFYSKQSYVGLYWLAFNLLFVPYLIVASSTRPIFLRSVAQWRGSKHAHAKMKTLTLLSLLGGGLVSGALAFACWVVVRFFLGPEWQEAANFAIALSMLLATLIMQTPLSFAISAFDLQRANLIAGVVQVGARFLAMAVSLQISDSAITAMISFSLASALTYIGYALYCLRVIRLRSPISSA